MATSAEVWRLIWTRVAPLGFVLGAGMEGFMYATGFWKTATRKEAERELEAAEMRRAMRADAARARTELLLGGGARAPAAAAPARPDEGSVRPPLA
jgi:hypothetical protein